jgi:hypothetical protein
MGSMWATPLTPRSGSAVRPGAARSPAVRAPTGPGAPAASSLDRPLTFDRVFRVVRSTVRSALGIERPGLGLALSDLPSSLGAYWPVTGNLIVMNEGLVEAMRANAASPREFNSFVYVILAHEYLHALGYLSEQEVRPVTARVAKAAFGPDHPATRMAEGNMWAMYPFLQYAPNGRGGRLKIVSGFDLATTDTYIR